MRQAIGIALLAASESLSVPCTAWSQTTSLPAAPPPDLAEITVIAPRPPTASEIAGNNVMIFVNSHSKPKEGGIAYFFDPHLRRGHRIYPGVHVALFTPLQRISGVY
jgi:hypothetical protein